MAKAACGFDTTPGSNGHDLLVSFGPTLLVSIGFDPNFKTDGSAKIPVPKAGIEQVRALVDTGATECCIDSMLAAQLSLPVIDKRKIAGVHGAQEVSIHLAQIYVPSLHHTIYGAFAGVHLVAGGQWHQALIGRSFLRSFTMVYEGKTGTVILSSD